MNNLNSHGIPVEGEMWMTSFLARRLRSRTIRIFSAFSLIVPTQCNLKFSLLHWKSYSAEKNYYNSWISDKLKAKMDKVSGPIIGPTRLRYFQWEIDVFRGENCENPKAKNFLRGSRHFFSMSWAWTGRSFGEKLSSQAQTEQRAVSNYRNVLQVEQF